MTRWLLTCKDVSRLVSESQDHRLPTGTRLALRLHLMMCRPCWHLSRQIDLLRNACRAETSPFERAVRLSPETARHIRLQLKHTPLPR